MMHARFIQWKKLHESYAQETPLTSMDSVSYHPILTLCSILLTPFLHIFPPPLPPEKNTQNPRPKPLDPIRKHTPTRGPTTFIPRFGSIRTRPPSRQHHQPFLLRKNLSPERQPSGRHIRILNRLQIVTYISISQGHT